MARCAHVSHVTFLLFFSLFTCPLRRPDERDCEEPRVKRNVGAFASEKNQIRENTSRVSTRQKSVFRETTTYNFVRENKEREKKKKTEEKKKREKERQRIIII